MPRETGVTHRRAATAIAWLTAKRAARSGAVWGVLFGVLVFNEAAGYDKNFPTPASRANVARAFGHNSAFTALMGPARQLDTVGGWVSWRVFWLLMFVGAIWGLLTATRLLRREEGCGAMGTVASRAHNAPPRGGAGHRRAGRRVDRAVGAHCGADGCGRVARQRRIFHLGNSVLRHCGDRSRGDVSGHRRAGQPARPTRRQANGLAAAVFGAAYLIRMAADSFTGLAWLRWASPLGWVENLHQLTGSQPLALLLIIVLAAAAAGAAVILAGRRDLGAAVLARRQSVNAGTRLLGGSFPLVVRLERWAALAWVGGLALFALIFGLTARSAAGAQVGASTVEQQVARMGGHQGGATGAWIGYEFVYLAALIAFAAAAQISGMRGEEAEGRLDNLLARHLNRGTWLAGRLGFSVALVLAAGLAAGLAGWVGVAGWHSGIGFGVMIQAGLNTAVPALFILGVGTLLYGLVPRLAAPILYTLILWSFLIEIIGSTITSNHWLLDTAILTHLGPVPATSLNWTAIAWLTGLAVIATLTGLAAFNRCDLAAA